MGERVVDVNCVRPGHKLISKHCDDHQEKTMGHSEKKKTVRSDAFLYNIRLYAIVCPCVDSIQCISPRSYRRDHAGEREIDLERRERSGLEWHGTGTGGGPQERQMANR